MKSTAKKIIAAVIAIVLLESFGAFAQTGGTYNLVKSTIACGGGRSSGGSFSISGTIGQSDAGYSAAGSYEVLGGFWPGEPISIINFLDYSRFSNYWLQSGCNSGNNWCWGADLDHLGSVNYADLKILCDQWLSETPEGWPLQ